MHDIAAHVAALIEFHNRLTEGKLDDQVAGVCTIDFNKALLARDTPSVTANPEDRREEIRLAAEAKAKERAAQLEKQP